MIFWLVMLLWLAAMVLVIWWGVIGWREYASNQDRDPATKPE